MTIQFYGHVESVSSNGAAPGCIEVHVVTDHTICPKEIWVNVPQDAAQHWLVGRYVNITMHAFDPPKAKDTGSDTPSEGV